MNLINSIVSNRFKIQITIHFYNNSDRSLCNETFNDNAIYKFEIIWTKHKSEAINEVLLQPIVFFTMLAKVSDYCLAMR